MDSKTGLIIKPGYPAQSIIVIRDGLSEHLHASQSLNVFR